MIVGSAAPAQVWSPLAAFLAASIAVGPGRHVVESDPVSSVAIYGFADWEGNGTTAASQLAPVDCGVFHDGFESGNTDEWSSTVP